MGNAAREAVRPEVNCRLASGRMLASSRVRHNVLPPLLHRWSSAPPIVEQERADEMGLAHRGESILESTDALLTLAEIAAAFAGFAALVSIIRRGSNLPADAVHDLLRLQLVIGTGVADSSRTSASTELGLRKRRVAALCADLGGGSYVGSGTLRRCTLEYVRTLFDYPV